MRFFLTLFLLLCGFLQSFSQENSLLWEVRSPKGKLQGYVYGTVHVQDYRLTKWDDNFMKAFKKCKYVAGELNMDDLDDNAMLANTSLIFMKDTVLSDLLDSAQLKVVMDTLTRYLGLGESEMASFEKIRPAFISITLQTLRASESSLEEMQANQEKYEDQLETGEVVDRKIQTMAKEHKMEVFGLETAEQQMKALLGGSSYDQAQELYKSIFKPVKKVGNTSIGEPELVVKYLEQDLAFFTSLLSSDFVSERLYRDLFLNRNITMVDKILEIMKKGKTFVAIGAGHLAGEGGVVDLLRKKGAILTPVRFEFTY